MSRIHYFADGYLLEAEGPNRQSTWVCMYNPSKREATLKFTATSTDVEKLDVYVPVTINVTPQEKDEDGTSDG